MKKIILVVTLLAVFSLFARNLNEQVNTRGLDDEVVLQQSNLGLKVSNFGCLGNVGNYGDGLIWPNLTSAGYCEHLFQANLWVSATRYRRNGNDELLYWLPDASSNEDVVTQSDPQWTPDLDVVIDTLTTTGYEGDRDVMEFLPAFNPLESIACNIFDLYNLSDVVLHNYGQFSGTDDDNDGLTDEDSPGRPFAVDDPEENWCFTIPYDDDGDGICDEDWDSPGFETTLAYYYDYSPFGTITERDWGDGKSQSSHYPLHLAIEQQTWSYPICGLEDMVFVNWKIHNTSTIDTLKYLSYGLMVDADIGPAEWDTIYNDDGSNYNGDPDYDYAFSYDYDGDDGLSQSILGARMLNCDYGISCWTWAVGDGPDDSDSQAFDLPSGTITHNEKYWLMTHYANPNGDKFLSLWDFPTAQTCPQDTRFMYSIYGAMPHTGDRDNNGILDYLETDENGKYFKRYDLAPLETKDLYAVMFIGTDSDDLDEKCAAAIDFYNSGFDLTAYMNSPSVPIIRYVQNYYHQLKLDWLNITIPDTLWVKYKQVDAPASDWTFIELPSETSEYIVEQITEADYYEFIIAAAFDDVYLESRKETFYFDPLLAGDENEIVTQTHLLSNYPNPFNPQTTISYQLSESQQVNISVYNLKGQLVTELLNETCDAGSYEIYWNAAKETSGIYFLKFRTPASTTIRKMLLLK
ncbi:MAG: T9SS type A sorting domain-containing protein [Candidatus Cloacimonetes bacterium]|nr:T9SS type A sorting domain-containing protein [Candidatus Cloacimonadota bacterium]